MFFVDFVTLRILMLNKQIDFFCSVKPFCQSPFGIGDGKSMIQSSAVAAATPAWQGRAIATSRLRLMEFSAYVQQRGEENNYQRHLFVHIASPLSYR